MEKKLDYEDAYFEKPEENIENEDLSNWLYDYWGNLDTAVERIATLAGKMHAFDVSKLGLNIRSIRRTNAGDVLQMAKRPEQEAAVLKLKDAINEAMGTTATVRYKPATALIEIHDLEPDTSEDEIIDAFSRSFESVQEVPIVIWTQLSFGGGKRAVVKLQEELATALLKRSSIVVGLVRCRVRIKDRVPRCYRCHNYGHLRTVCTGPDRTALCMTCGCANHHAIECSNPPRCVLCLEDGGDGNHYPGSAKCNAFQLAKRKK